ncbi:hypothetical protein [Massilia sp. DD77]|uniref:hypothetical protein n=1 Tax=Massilia sp. DD77 TaxID=3109349 RepID=UPI003000E31E
MNTDNVLAFERRAPPSPPADFDAVQAIRTCRSLVQSLGQYDLSEIVYEACVAMLLVNLHDLLQTARAIGKPLVFAEYLDPKEDATNITELVAKCRNAACHVWTKSSATKSTVYRFYRVAGYCPRATVLDDKALGCDYHDDVALYYGRHRLYLKRHVLRAIEELAVVFGGAATAV